MTLSEKGDALARRRIRKALRAWATAEKARIEHALLSLGGSDAEAEAHGYINAMTVVISAIDEATRAPKKGKR